jgi:hypothetical protein
MALSVGDVIFKFKADLKNFKKGMAEAQKDIKNFSEKTTEFGKDMRDFGLKASVAVAAVGAATIKLGNDAAKYNTVRRAFEGMTEGMVDNVDEFQRKVSEASGNTIANYDILTGANKALSLIGKEAFTDFGTQFADMANLATKSAATFGESADYMFNSLITGSARESKMILDNLGITIDLTAAKEEYAKTLGKSADEMTASEGKAAVLNKTLELLRDNYKATEIDVNSFEVRMAALKKQFSDTKIEIGNALLPVITEFANTLQPIIDEYLPILVNKLKELVDWFRSLSEEKKEMVVKVTLLVAAIAPLIAILGVVIATFGAVVAFISSPVTLAILALIATVTALYAAFNKNILGIEERFNSFLDFLKWIGQQIFETITNPWAKALEVVTEIAKKIKEKALEKINPFHRESPSLVDNVRAGVAEIINSYASLENLSAKLPTLAHEDLGRTGGDFEQNVNIQTGPIMNQQDIESLGRQFAFRTQLQPGMRSF